MRVEAPALLDSLMTTVSRLRFRTHRAFRYLSMVGIFAASGCKGCSPSTNQAPTTFPVSLPTPAYVQANLETTDPTIAMGNLGAQLESAHKAVARKPHDVGAKAALIGLLLGHSHVIGSPAELVYRMGYNPLHARIWRGQ